MFFVYIPNSQLSSFQRNTNSRETPHLMQGPYDTSSNPMGPGLKPGFRFFLFVCFNPLKEVENWVYIFVHIFVDICEKLIFYKPL